MEQSDHGAGRMERQVGRFAPSTTGPAHPGTLLAALLCWLDARARGARVLLRLEDLDPQRSRAEWSAELERDLAWLGLDWDAVLVQSGAAAAHEEALDSLATAGRLYPCACTRRDLRAHGERGPDGGFRYPNTCRGRALPSGGWRAAAEPLRAQLPDGWLPLHDESGLDLSQDPASALGDPVVRRRDGAVSYLLASVVDDADAGVTRVVRGRDLAVTTATQVRLQQLLALRTPDYRHHLLLLERHGGKLAKLHGSIAVAQLRDTYTAPALCGVLAAAAGLRQHPEPVTPRALLEGFRWDRVATDDRLLVLQDGRLALHPG